MVMDAESDDFRALITVQADTIATLQARVATLENDIQYLQGYIETLKNRTEALDTRLNGDRPLTLE